MEIIKATTDDIEVIRQIADIAFVATYKDILSTEQLQYMMNWMYSKENLQKQYSEGHVFFIAHEGDKAIGYVSVQPEDKNNEFQIYHLQKIYLLPEFQKKGYGKKMFNHIVQYIYSLSIAPFTIKLNVNRNNPAIHFYEHLGMKRISEGDFPIGEGFYMNDYIMGKDYGYTIYLNNGVARNPYVRLPYPATVKIAKEEQIAIIGPNAAGKSLLIDMLTGKYPLREGTLTYDFFPSNNRMVYENIKYITFRDTYGSADDCYQMRWNQTEQDSVPYVNEILGQYEDNGFVKNLLDTFSIRPMLNKKIVSLSSGELRKFQLVKSLMNHPQVLIIDNPFIGLDEGARQLLDNVLSRLVSEEHIQIILVLSMLDDVPSFITHVIPVDNGTVKEKMTRNEYICNIENLFSYSDIIIGIDDIAKQQSKQKSNEEIVKLNHVTIKYGEREIIKNLDWTINKGECWALSGENGSGKSTLLSLICADNPQSYACDISLFGNRRGSGESIWEIKKHIGYVSPEMHRSYMRDIPAIKIVASGLHDSIGLYVNTHDEMLQQCRFWMKVFGIADKENTSFLQLSSGEQRLVLLARAFVKNPELIILDEPLHGLDTFNRRKVKRIIETFSRQSDKTLIMVTHYRRELPNTISNTLILNRNE